MRMNRYNAATGKREHFPEQERFPQEKREPPRPKTGRGGSGMDLSAILNRLDQGDLLLMLILFLLWRESGDKELLIALGAFLFL